MKTSILAVFLTFGLVATVQAGHPSDVGPASLFYDYDKHEINQPTASGTTIQRDRGVVYIKDGMKKDEMLVNEHTDIVPSALLW